MRLDGLEEIWAADVFGQVVQKAAEIGAKASKSP